MSQLPSFLIIGAQKSATTTLYADLGTHPRVFFPIDKEPNNLCHDDVLADAGRAEYAAMFAGAKADQLCGEASTAYTKRPTFEGMAQRARELLGPDLRVIYSVREPIARIISHHHHIHTEGAVGADINTAVRDEPTLIEYTRYATQLRPWLDAFGRDRVLVVRFEDFVKDRRTNYERMARHLGLEPEPDRLDTEKVHNRSEGKAVHRGFWTTIYHHPAYRSAVRPLLPAKLRRFIIDTLLPKGPGKLAPPTTATVDYLLDRLSDDLAELPRMLGRSEPLWDLEAVRAKHSSAAGDAVAGGAG